MRRVWAFQVIAACLLAAGCSSLDNIPLSDVPIPEPRAENLPDTGPSKASCAKCGVQVAKAEVAAITPAEPVAAAAPELDQTATSEPSATASLLPQIGISSAHAAEDPANPSPSNVADAAPSEAAAPPLFEPATYGPEAGEPAPAGADAIERRDLIAAGGCVNDVFRVCPRAATPAEAEAAGQPAATNGASDDIMTATVARLEIPSLDFKTIVWYLIGFAALVGLFVSARQPTD